MANKEMKTLTINGNTFEIVDESARNTIASVFETETTVESSGNLFDNNFDESGKINLTTGADEDDDVFKRTSAWYELGDDFKGTVYLATSNNSDGHAIVIWYDQNKSAIGYNPFNTDGINGIVIRTEAKFFRIYATTDFAAGVKAYVSHENPGTTYDKIDYSTQTAGTSRVVGIKQELIPESEELKDIRTGYDGTVYETAGDAVRGQIAGIADIANQNTGAMNTAFGRTVTVDFDGVENGVVYNKSFPTGAALASYNTHYKAVTAGEIYSLTTTMPANENYSAAWFWDSDGAFVSGAGWYGDVGASVSNYPIVVPKNAVLMRVVAPTYVIPTMSQDIAVPFSIYNALLSVHSVSVSFKDEVCTIKTAYRNNEYFVIEIFRGNGNNIPDIKKAYIVDENDAVIRTLLSNGTDIISPHVLYAENNADGDNLDSDGNHNFYFTGGNHQYNNTGSGSTATARCETFTVLCDGKTVSDTVTGNEVVLMWTNYIQAYNTTKADGSGREVMREDVRLSIIGATINVEIRHTALEDIVREIYYGLQMSNNYFSTIAFPGGSNRAAYTIGTAVDSGDNNCRTVRLSTANADVLEIQVEPIDLGLFQFNTYANNIFSTAYYKNYFRIIDGKPLAQNTGDITILKGSYKVFPGF